MSHNQRRSSDTIFAPITPPGMGSVCVVRISGKLTTKCLAHLGIDKILKPWQAHLCKIYDKDESPLDEALVSYFKAPQSFTGEDVAELSLHSSKYIVSRLFSLLASLDGVRLAERGEFSKRAFLNSKIDLLQAESIADLIAAETKLQHDCALQQLRGKNSTLFSNLRNDLLELLTHLEVAIDFPEDELDMALVGNLKQKIGLVEERLKSALDRGKIGLKIRDGIKITILGKPNVGKSTFLNFLANGDVVMVSSIAGTTRDVVSITLDVAGIPVVFSDTAGLRETDDILESEGIRRALENAKNADFHVVLLEPGDINMEGHLEEFRKNEINGGNWDENTLIFLNKSDLATAEQLIEFRKLYPNGEEISLKFDSHTERIMGRLEEIITNNHRINPNDENISMSYGRYRDELLKALEFLEETRQLESLPLEVLAENIRCAASCLGHIVGEISTEDVLDSIFSRFCLGK